MTVTITIQCDNAAFQPDPAEELACILRVIAAKLPLADSIHHFDERKLYDVNGNAVGLMTVRE